MTKREANFQAQLDKTRQEFDATVEAAMDEAVNEYRSSKDHQDETMLNGGKIMDDKKDAAPATKNQPAELTSPMSKDFVTTPATANLPETDNDPIKKGDGETDAGEHPPSVEKGNGESEMQQGSVVLDAETYRQMFDAFVTATENMKALHSDIESMKGECCGVIKGELAAAKEKVDEYRLLNNKYQDESARCNSENAGLKKQLKDAENQIKQLREGEVELKATVEEQRKEIAGLKDKVNDAEDEEKNALTEQKRKFDEELSQKEQDYDKEMEKLQEESSKLVIAEQQKLERLIPAAVSELFDFDPKQEEVDQRKASALFAYLSFITGNLKGDAFAERFKVFDESLYEALRDDADQLADCRNKIQKYINETLSPKIGGLQVRWPKIGDECNTDYYSASDFGVTITAVISGMVFRKSVDGKVQCLSKGKVETE